jgi:DNA mismatch repair protein MutL
MGLIHILPETIANKIAAGEVIERPASIVKELIENSLDAGAKSIEVAIRHGGKSLIRVSDDGSGMSPDDAELAFQRYATSKISTAKDLERIGSYGFRGEALPSIAAVSRVKLQTRNGASDAGVEIEIEGGKSSGARQASCRKGTIIEVRDLFFNTPARRKFMKADSTEAGQVIDTVSNLALSRLDVQFVLKSADKTIFDLLPGENLKARAASIFGETEAQHLLEIQAQVGAVGVRGLIGKPQICRANRTGQIYFINQRLIKSSSLSFAIQAGYHGLLMHGQFPVAVLLFDLDLERVDVNVHPTKQEVRISNEAEIKSIIKNIIAQRLADEGDLAPQIPTTAGFAPQIQNEIKSWLSATPSATRVDIQTERLSFSEPAASYNVHSPMPLAESISLKDKLQITKVLGQIHNTFIIAETDEGYMIIDQHAAHERVMFEVLLKNFETEQPARQGLLIEEILQLPAKHEEALKESLSLLNKLGFEIEEFGQGSFIIRSVPAILEGEAAVPLLKTFLEEKEDGKVSTDLEKQQENIAALIACKKRSVRAFDPLNAVALKTLLERLAQCENPFSCPHGRPTFFKQTFLELERQFKRK